jgi:hypothetical protein
VGFDGGDHWTEGELENEGEGEKKEWSGRRRV